MTPVESARSELPFEVLVVCTGNIARSPMAQRMLEHRLAGNPGVRVSSAGTWGLTGSPMEPNAAEALAEVGIDDGGFRARELTPGLVRSSDLVLTATREHRVAVLTHDPTALRRTFTLREFARLVDSLDAVPGRPGHIGRTPAELVAAAADARGRVRVTPTEDDIADPHSRPLAAFRRARDLIASAVDLVGPALGSGNPPSERGEPDPSGSDAGPGLQ